MTHDSEKYEVGYKKPPTETRFKRGQSGNPKGRALGSRNIKSGMAGEGLSSIVMQEAYRAVPVHDGERRISMSMLQATVRSLAVSAAKGQVRAQRVFINMVEEVEKKEQCLRDEYLKTLIEYKYHWETKIEECRLQKLPIPDPLPHPNDIRIDVRTGAAQIMGPMTPEEKKEWDALRAHKADYIFYIQQCEQFLLDHPECPDKQPILDAIARTQKTLDKIRLVIPD